MRCAVSRPAARNRIPTSTMTPPSDVLVNTTVRYSSVVRDEQAVVGARHDAHQQPPDARPQQTQQQIPAPPRTEQGNAVAQQARHWLDVVGELADSEKHRDAGGSHAQTLFEQELERQFGDGKPQIGAEPAQADEKGHRPHIAGFAYLCNRNVCCIWVLWQDCDGGWIFHAAEYVLHPPLSCFYGNFVTIQPYLEGNCTRPSPGF